MSAFSSMEEVIHFFNQWGPVVALRHENKPKNCLFIQYESRKHSILLQDAFHTSTAVITSHADLFKDDLTAKSVRKTSSNSESTSSDQSHLGLSLLINGQKFQLIQVLPQLDLLHKIHQVAPPSNQTKATATTTNAQVGDVASMTSSKSLMSSPGETISSNITPSLLLTYDQSKFLSTGHGAFIRKHLRQPSSFPSSSIILHFVIQPSHVTFRYHLKEVFGVKSFSSHLKNISLVKNDQRKSKNLDTSKVNVIKSLPPSTLVDYNEETSNKSDAESSWFLLLTYANPQEASKAFKLLQGQPFGVHNVSAVFVEDPLEVPTV